ncbi:hypothetical protein KP509_23G011700 [Ceratopteris richardii]|uniref:Uncharacterized protein n=1 Tax=Ceratopteris richardii TaxID=49495 RepID=A0A8T2RZL9_CERRI|nr:hypothetical protein KP509_23G011700 [Ceratopteris richardii]
MAPDISTPRSASHGNISATDCGATNLYRSSDDASLSVIPAQQGSELSSPPNSHHRRTNVLSPSPGRSVNVSADLSKNEAMKKSMGLKKLRQQSASRSLAAAFDGVMNCSVNHARKTTETSTRWRASTTTEKGTMTTDIDSESDSQKCQLKDGSTNNDGPSNRTSKEIPLRAKIAAAMDAEGRIGVISKIESTLQEERRQRLSEQQSAVSPGSCENSISLLNKKRKAKGCCRSAASGRGGRWIVRRRLRYARSFLGNLWRRISRLLLHSTKGVRVKKL